MSTAQQVTSAGLDERRPTRKKGQKIFTSKTVPLYIMVLPVFFLTLFFKYIPLPGRLIAFMDYRISGFNGWVGLDHFRFLFNLDYFWQSFVNHWRFIILGYIFMFPAPIILAILLNELRNKAFRKTIQTLTVLPNFINWVVIAGIFMTLLSPRYGWVNDLIRAFGGKPIFFLSLPDVFPPLLTFLRMWKGVGYSAIIYLAALSGIDPELYEAAIADGAGRFKQTIHVTIPGLAPTIIVLFVLSFTKIFAGLFEPILVLKNPMIVAKAEVLDTYIYEVGLKRSKYGLGAAAGLFKMTISLAFVLGANWLSKHITPDKRSIL